MTGIGAHVTQIPCGGPRDSLPIMIRKIAFVGLILLIVLLAVPLGIGMAMGPSCPDCHLPGGSGTLGFCLAVLATLGVILVAQARPLVTGPRTVRTLLLPRSLDHPPEPFPTP